MLTLFEVFESDVAIDAPETTSGDINRVERINDIILMTDHLQSIDSIYRYSEFSKGFMSLACNFLSRLGISFENKYVKSKT